LFEGDKWIAKRRHRKKNRKSTGLLHVNKLTVDRQILL